MPSPIAQFLFGLKLVPRAFALIFTRPKLFLLSLASAFVAAFVLVGSALALWPFSQGVAKGIISSTSTPGAVLATGLGFLIFAACWSLAALTLPNVLLAPLQDPLSEATEMAVSAFVPPAFSVQRLIRSVALSLSHTFARLALVVFGSALLFPLHFVPGIGTAAWWILSTLWTSLCLAAEYVSGPAARHLLSFSSVVRVLRRRLGATLGFGLCAFVLLWVPILQFFFMPVAVVAGTLLFESLRREGIFTAA
jgi:CysZ protein